MPPRCPPPGHFRIPFAYDNCSIRIFDQKYQLRAQRPQSTLSQLAAEGKEPVKKVQFTVLAALLPALLLAPPAVNAQASPAHPKTEITFSGFTGHLPGPYGVVLAEAELALGRNTNPQHVATRLLDVPVAAERVADGDFRIRVPSSSTLRRAERLGRPR